MTVGALAAGRYKVERELGTGAMARVLLARDQELGRQVALKLLDEHLAEDDSIRARFAREARVAAALSHPNVVGVFDVGVTEDGRPFIVMEYVEGRTLAERLLEQGALHPDEVRRIGLQVCAGLEHAHEHGLIHRDVKPGNLIERSDGTVKIADFGIARAIEATGLTDAGTILGTAAYLAPEQAEGGEVTTATDVFGLGVVLYELVTGRRPWEVESLAALAGRRNAPVPELPPGTPSALRSAIERCLQPEPEDRPASAREVASLLEEPDEDATVVLKPERPVRRERRGIGAPAWVAAALGALVLLLAAAGALLVATGDGGSGTEGAATQTAPAVQPVPDGATPGEDARNLAEWLREQARDG